MDIKVKEGPYIANFRKHVVVAAHDMFDPAKPPIAARMPSLSQVLDDPHNAPLPEGAGAYLITGAMLAGHVDAQTLTKVLEYVSRWESMEHRCWFLHVLSSGPHIHMALENEAFCAMTRAHGSQF